MRVIAYFRSRTISESVPGTVEKRLRPSMADATAAAADATSTNKEGPLSTTWRVRGARRPSGSRAEEVIDALAVHAYDPADIANPALASTTACESADALDVPWTDADERETDATRPPSTLELERVGVARARAGV